MAEVIGIVIGIPGLIHLCFKLGENLRTTIQAYHSSGEHYDDIFNQLSSHELLFQNSLRVVQNIWEGLSPHTALLIENNLRSLRDELSNANELLIEYWQASSTRHRILRRPSIIEKLEMIGIKVEKIEAHIQFAIVIYGLDKNWSCSLPPEQIPLIPFTLPPTTSRNPGLETDWLREEDAYPLSTLRPIPYSSIGTAGHLCRSSADSAVLIQLQNPELKPSRFGHSFPPTFSEVEKETIMELTHMLAKADPLQMGILPCQGVFFRRKTLSQSQEKSARDVFSRFEMIFKLPSGYATASPQKDTPRTLRDLLLDTTSRSVQHPLEERVRLGKDLARAVFHVHAAKFVHKNIRPENIIVVSSDEEFDRNKGFPYSVGRGFLLGFDKCRLDENPSLGIGDGDDLPNLYRHPRRWGLVPEEKFRMDHDIYSLGVTLLELGLWTPLLSKKVFTTAGSERVMWPNFESTLGKMLKCQRKREVQDYLIRTAETKLRAAMGSVYSQVVVACLKGVQVRNNANREETVETTIESAYLESVLQKLDSIAM